MPVPAVRQAKTLSHTHTWTWEGANWMHQADLLELLEYASHTCSSFSLKISPALAAGSVQSEYKNNDCFSGRYLHPRIETRC